MMFEVVGTSGRGSHLFDSVADAVKYLRWLHSMGEDVVVYEAYLYKGRVIRRGYCAEIGELAAPINNSSRD